MPTTQAISDPAKAREFFEAKMAFTTGPVELERMMKNNEVNVVDVRAAEDFAEGHIPGAINLPKDQWHALKGLRKDKQTSSTAIRRYAISPPLPPWNSPPKVIPLWSWKAAGAGGRTTASRSKNEITGGGFARAGGRIELCHSVPAHL